MRNPATYMIAAALAASGCTANSTDVKSTDLPAPVLSTLEHEAQGGRIDKLVKETTTAAVTYKAQVIAPSTQHWEIVIDGSGTLVYRHPK